MMTWLTEKGHTKAQLTCFWVTLNALRDGKQIRQQLVFHSAPTLIIQPKTNAFGWNADFLLSTYAHRHVFVPTESLECL